MFDYFTKNKASYAHLTDEEIIGTINQYCARLITINKKSNTSALGTALSGLFLGEAYNSGDLLHVANERFGIVNPQGKNPHNFLSQIAEAATRKGIKSTEHIADYADIYNRAGILLDQMPKDEVRGIKGIFTAVKTMKSIAASHKPRL